MATALMINDDVSINRFNPYTWSGTYGVPVDGSHWLSDGTYTVQYDDMPSPPIDPNRDLKDFNPVHVFRSGPVMVDEMPGRPVAPFPLFPARKYEYNNGDLTWLPSNYNYTYDRGFIGSSMQPDWALGPRLAQKKRKGWDMALVVGALVLILVAYSRMKR
jgi:hypothetical protein